jgi:hypothetical protein
VDFGTRNAVWREVFVASAVLSVALVLFMGGRILSNAADRIPSRAQVARMELAGEGNPFRQTGFVKTERQKRYERSGAALLAWSRGVLLFYPVYLGARAVLGSLQKR